MRAGEIRVLKPCRQKLRSPVSFGILSDWEPGDVLFCGMPCEPGTPLEAPPCATRPPPARPARNGGFLFCDTLPACRRPEPVHRGFSGCFALVLRVRADMPRRGWGSATEVSFLECPTTASGPPLRGLTGPFSLKTVHWTVFRAFEPTTVGRQGGRCAARPYKNPSDRNDTSIAAPNARAAWFS